MPRTADERVMMPYLRKLMREHRALNKMIDTTKALGAQHELRQLKRIRLNLKDKIRTMQRHYSWGRATAN